MSQLRVILGLGGAAGLAKSALGGLVDGFGKLGLASLGVKAVVESVASLAGGLVSGNAEFERYNVQFGVLLGSSEAAKKLPGGACRVWR